MKTVSRLSLVLILAGSLCPAGAQVTLTRVLEGDIATATKLIGTVEFTDSDAALSTQKFYRVASHPLWQGRSQKRC